MPKLFLVLVATLSLVISPVAALAQGAGNQQDDPNSVLTQDQAFLGEAGLPIVSVGATVAAIIKAVLGLLGIIFIILIIYAGLLWMTSAGNEDSIEKAKSIMTAAVIGLVITMSAYAITLFVIDSLFRTPSRVEVF